MCDHQALSAYTSCSESERKNFYWSSARWHGKVGHRCNVFHSVRSWTSECQHQKIKNLKRRLNKHIPKITNKNMKESTGYKPYSTRNQKFNDAAYVIKTYLKTIIQMKISSITDILYITPPYNPMSFKINVQSLWESYMLGTLAPVIVMYHRLIHE